MAKKLSAGRIYLYNWLLPGLGYYARGQKAKAVLIFVLIGGTFAAGLFLGGGVFVLSEDFISKVSGAGRLGAGLLWLAALAPGLRYADMLSPYGEIGSCFTAVAGLLNLLSVMSSGDIGRQ